MARNATPLLCALPLPELRGGVELLIVETLLAHPDPTGVGGHENEHGLCVLLLVEPTESERQWMRSEAQRYVGARASVVHVAGDDWAASVGRVLGEFNSAFVDMVFGLPSHSAEVEQRVVALLQALKTGHHQLCTVVAVTADPAAWPTMGKSTGFAVPNAMSVNAGAIAIHAGLAQVSAPQMIECVTAEHVRAVFGAPGRAATLQMTDALGLLNAIKSVDQTEQLGSLCAAAAFFLDDLGLQGYSAAAGAMRAAGLGEPLIVAPGGLTIPSALNASPRCVLVVMRGDDRAKGRGNRGEAHA